MAATRFGVDGENYHGGHAKRASSPHRRHGNMLVAVPALAGGTKVVGPSNAESHGLGQDRGFRDRVHYTSSSAIGRASRTAVETKAFRRRFACTTGPLFVNGSRGRTAQHAPVDGQRPVARLPTFWQQLRRRCLQTAFANSGPSSDRARRSVSSSRPRVGPMLPIGTARRALISA